MGVRCEDFKYVYLCEQKRKYAGAWPYKLQRKIGATSIDSPLQRTDALCNGDLHYQVIKIWHRPADAAAVEWVSKHILKDRGERGFEHVYASTDECLEVIQNAIELVEARDFRRWPKCKWPKCLRMLTTMETD